MVTASDAALQCRPAVRERAPRARWGPFTELSQLRAGSQSLPADAGWRPRPRAMSDASTGFPLTTICSPSCSCEPCSLPGRPQTLRKEVDERSERRQELLVAPGPSLHLIVHGAEVKRVRGDVGASPIAWALSASVA